MFSKISASLFSNISFKGSKTVSTNKLEKSPNKDCIEINSEKSPTISPEVKKVLDSMIFSFRKHNGENYEGTIKDYLQSSLIGTRPMRNISLIHCTSTKDTAEQMIKTGLDWTKTGRMKCGPGSYFLPSAAGGAEQGAGNIPVEGIYIGDKKEYAIFEPCFYDAIENHTELKEIVSKLQKEDARKTINQYCHNIIEKDMGIDILYASSGRGVGSYVVFNDKCMKLQKPNW